jgi:hypothetical protein
LKERRCGHGSAAEADSAQRISKKEFEICCQNAAKREQSNSAKLLI